MWEGRKGTEQCIIILRARASALKHLAVGGGRAAVVLAGSRGGAR